MQNNYLDIEIDLKNIEDSRKPDLVVKIPRPRKRKLPEPTTQVSDEFVKQSNPDTVANVNTLNRESFNMGEIKDDEDIEAAIKTVDWGDFDVNKLIELLCHLSQAITGIELKPYQLPIQRRIFKSILLNEGLTISALISRQAGKCLKKGTKVIMLDGSLKAVEDVKVGDKLLGPDSTPREVLSTTKGVDKLYTVTPKSGYALPYTVNSEHILVFTDRNSRELHKIKPNEYLNSTKYKREEFYRGIRAKVDFPKQDLPINPYFLGVWLGDGDSSKPTITTPDKELIDYIQDFATSLSMRVSFEKTNRNCERLHIVRTETSGNNRLLDMLRDMNLIDNKHIPLKYLAGNEEDRYKLLAGLIDTDGHKPSKKGKEATLEITFANKTLAEQTCFLARSLGFRVSIKEKLARIKSINYECIVYRISIYGETWKIPTKVKRKTSTPILLRENTLTYGVSIVEEGEGEYYGFALDKDHLFLLEDFTITHNSEAAACSVTTLCSVMPALSKHFPEQLGTYKHGFMVGIYAPSGEQAKTLYDRVKARAHSESALAVYEDPDISTGIDRHGCKWKNGSFVLMQSASPKSNVESKSFHLIIFDESQDGDEFVINKSIYPMLAWGNGTMVMIGTVSEKPCLFYDTIQQNVAEDVNRSAEDKCHFEYRWDEVIKHNPKYKVHIDNMKKKHGEHSKYFQMAYNLKWYFEEGRAVTDLDLKQYTMGIKVGLTQYTNSAVVIGIDLARKTNGSVVTVGQLMNQEAIFEDGEVEKFVTVKVCDWLEIEDIPYPQQRPIMKDFISRYPNVVAIAVDCTGVGDAIFSEMQEEWDFYCQMIPFIFSSKSKHQLMNLFYEFMWKNRLIIPSTEDVRKMNKWQRFYLQMINLERVNQNGYTYLAKPTRNSARDDYPDSLFLMLHAAKEAIKNSGQIETYDVKNLYRTDSRAFNPNSGFEAFRENIRSGNYNKGSLREQRVNKLMKGII